MEIRCNKIYFCNAIAIAMTLLLAVCSLSFSSVAYASNEQLNANSGTYSVDFQQKIDGNAEGITATYKLSYAGSPSYASEVVMPNGVKGSEYVFVLPGNTSQTLTFSFPHAGVWSYKIACTSVDYEGDAKTIEKDSLDRNLTIYVANSSCGGYSYESIWTVSGSKTTNSSITHAVVENPVNTSSSSVAKASDIDLAPFLAAVAAVLMGSGIFIYIMRRRKDERDK